MFALENSKTRPAQTKSHDVEFRCGLPTTEEFPDCLKLVQRETFCKDVSTLDSSVNLLNDDWIARIAVELAPEPMELYSVMF